MNSDSPRWLNRLPLRFNELALLVAIVVVLLATGLVDSNHSYFNNWDISARDIIRQTSLLGIFALGAAVVIIAGGIDLSSGSTIAFSSTTCATIMLVLAPVAMRDSQPVGGWVVAVAMAGTIVVGFLIGTLHTWLITSIRLPPFVATLATLVGLRSFARALCEFVTAKMLSGKSTQINVADPCFRYIRENVWIYATIFGVLALLTWLVLSRTVLGRHLYALGGNEQAARLSGIRTENVKWAAYCFAAVTSSIAGILYVANDSVAAPVNQGRGYELNAIASAVVGGCSLQGGLGTVPGTILGALFLRVVIDAVAKLIKTGADVYEGLIVGVVVVLAVTFSQIQQLWGSGRRLFPGGIGLVAIPTLALLGGVVCAMTVGPLAGLVVGVVLLLLLIAIRVVETVRTRQA